MHQMFYHDVHANDPEVNWCRGAMQIVEFSAEILWKQQANIDNIIINWNAHPYKCVEKSCAQYKWQKIVPLDCSFTRALTCSGSSIIHRSTRFIFSLKLCIYTLHQRFRKVFLMLKKLVNLQITCNFSMMREDALPHAMIHHNKYLMSQMSRCICSCLQSTWQPIPLYPICLLMQWSTMVLFHMSLKLNDTTTPVQF